MSEREEPSAARLDGSEKVLLLPLPASDHAVPVIPKRVRSIVSSVSTVSSPSPAMAAPSARLGEALRG